MWVSKGIINIIDLSRDYYLVTFTHEDDKNDALSDGPWFIYDHYLTLKEWSPEFYPESDSIINVAVWIRISGLPIEYYDAKMLHAIGDRVGRTIKVDKNTIQRERGKYVRICVEVNILKPSLGMCTIKENNYKIEYKGLHMLYLKCGKYGHYVEGCQVQFKEKERVPNAEASVIVRNDKVMIEGTNASINKNGPWQIIQKQRRGWKQADVAKKQSVKQLLDNSWGVKFGSRFSSLVNDGGETSGIKKVSGKEF